MSLLFQVPRYCLLWLLIAQSLIILPHSERLPSWVLIAWIVCVSWRLMIFRGRLLYPGKLIKIVLVIMSFAGIVKEYGNIVGLEPAVAVLITAYLLKLLEMRTKRDILLLIHLSYFVTVTQLLFFQGIPAALYMGLCLVVASTALIALHQSAETNQFIRPFRIAGLMVLQALPLMLLMFLVFPRIDPFWSVPLPSHQAKTGMGDSMSPGDVSKLAQSDALAFRAVFEGEIPERSQLYWRGLVLSNFDGHSWTSTKRLAVDSAPINYLADDPNIYSYELIMEPTQQNWLFTLPVAQARGGKYSGSSAAVRYRPEFTLSTHRPIKQRIKVAVSSNINAIREPRFYPHLRQMELRLPAQVNPDSRDLALQWRRTASNDLAYINRVLSFFREQPFVYTLQPPRLGNNGIDQFLFDTRRGFCEHYAGSFTFLMRAAGIPARVVVGYQGGTKSPFENYLSIRQLDAHAWSEVWLEGRGWVRVDPTAAVSPDRIELGGEEVLSGQDSFLANSPLSPLKLRNIQWIKQLQQRYDQLNYSWHQLVLGYDNEMQMETLKALLGEVSPQRLVIAILSVGGGVLGLIALQLLLSQPLRRKDPAVKVYQKFCRKIKKVGLERSEGETAGDFSKRIVAMRPDLKSQVEAITVLFEEIQYQDQLVRKNKIQHLKQLVRKLSVRRVHLPYKKVPAC